MTGADRQIITAYHVTIGGNGAWSTAAEHAHPGVWAHCKWGGLVDSDVSLAELVKRQGCVFPLSGVLVHNRVACKQMPGAAYCGGNQGSLGITQDANP